MSQPLTLISHILCPYVQRAAILLAEKQVPFERRDIDLANKPDWFLAVSPLGKTPVLLVGDQAIFESAVICEYLDETQAPRMHADDALLRARERSWMEFGSALLNNIAGFYGADSEAQLMLKAGELAAKFRQVEAALGQGPYFGGERFSLVDAVFGPIFRYFDVFDMVADFVGWSELPKVSAWRARLAQRPSVRSAVSADYPELLHAFLLKRNGALALRMRQPALAA